MELLKTKQSRLPFKVRERLELSNTDFRCIEEVFDLIMAFEVLEHIANDELALLEIHDMLKSSGYFLFSVPSHQLYWGANDVWAGHVRRYERQELIFKLQKCGFKVNHFWSYGFPIANVIEPLKNKTVSMEANTFLTLEEKTEISGVRRIGLKPFKYLLNDWIFSPFYLLQKVFLKGDLGNGYLVLVQKNRI